MYAALEPDMNIPDYRPAHAFLLRIGVLSLEELDLLDIRTKLPPSFLAKNLPGL
jgi:hypothetical protein